MVKTLKVGVALGSGISRGMAHIGVLQVLKEHNIPVEYVAGTSIGAVVGAFYCAGFDLNYMTRFAAQFPPQTLIDFSFSKKGLVEGKKLREFFRLFFKDKTFDELYTPLAVVATDLVKCERVIIRKGLLVDALRASTSIPGVFTPFQYEGRLLVDGGVTDRVPATVLKEMGAQIIIASDVGFDGGDFEIKSFLDVIIRSLGIMEKEIVKTRVSCADIVIKPKVDDIDPTSFEEAQLCVQRGREATEKVLPRIFSITLHNHR